MTESMATLELSLLLLVAACPGGVDSDFDGLSDSCELEVATQFAPIFVVSPSACNWDASAERLGGAYLFGVSPIPDGLRISYLPAYLDDCGWAGPKCLLRWRGGCDPHAGDSEFIALDLATDTLRGGWRVDRVFLSAHCFGRGDDDCRWYSPGELQWLDGRRSFGSQRVRTRTIPADPPATAATGTSTPVIETIVPFAFRSCL